MQQGSCRRDEVSSSMAIATVKGDFGDVIANNGDVGDAVAALKGCG